MSLKMLKLVEASARKKEHSDRMAQQQDERIKKMQEAVEYANSDAVFWKGAALKYADRLVAMGMSDFVKSWYGVGYAYWTKVRNGAKVEPGDHRFDRKGYDFTAYKSNS